MLKLIGVELFKLRKRMMPYVLLAVLLAIVLVPIVVNYSNYRSALARYPDIESYIVGNPGATSGGPVVTTIVPGTTPGTPPSAEEREKMLMASMLSQWKKTLVLPDAMQSIFSFVPSLGMLLVVLLSASVVGSEYGWGTLRQMLAKGTSRNNYLTSKLLTIAIAVFAGVLIVVSAGLFATIITSMLVEGGIAWSGFAAYFFGSLGRTLLVLSVSLSLAALFAVLLRSATMGMAAAAAGFIGEPIIVSLLSGSSGWLSEAARYTIGHNTSHLLVLNGSGYFAGELEPWWRATIILTAYVAVFLGAAYLFFRRQDLTA